MGFAEIRNLSLTLLLIVLSGILVLSMTSSADATNTRAVRGSANATKSARVPVMNNDTETNDIQQLVRILGDAYENSLLHNTSNADMEAKDLRLESASIELSSRILSEIAKPSYDYVGESGRSECALDRESMPLKNLTDVLSYAAYRLENLIRSSPSASEENSRHAATMAQIESMEHLYV